MEIIRLTAVCSRDASFLCHLMNEPSILAALNEIPTTLSDWEGYIPVWEQDPDEEDFILFYANTPVGWLGINGLLSGGKTAYIKMLALLPEYQHMGFGRSAVRQSLKILNHRGFSSAALFTNQINLKAQACYRSCGFEITEAFTEEMADGMLVKRCKMECTLP